MCKNFIRNLISFYSLLFRLNVVYGADLSVASEVEIPAGGSDLSILSLENLILLCGEKINFVSRISEDPEKGDEYKMLLKDGNEKSFYIKQTFVLPKGTKVKVGDSFFKVDKDTDISMESFEMNLTGKLKDVTFIKANSEHTDQPIELTNKKRKGMDVMMNFLGFQMTTESNIVMQWNNGILSFKKFLASDHFILKILNGDLGVKFDEELLLNVWKISGRARPNFLEGWIITSQDIDELTVEEGVEFVYEYEVGSEIGIDLVVEHEITLKELDASETPKTPDTTLLDPTKPVDDFDEDDSKGLGTTKTTKVVSLAPSQTKLNVLYTTLILAIIILMVVLSCILYMVFYKKNKV